MATFVGSATTNGGSIDISTTGRLAGDRCILVNYAAKFSGSPADAPPAGFTAIPAFCGAFFNVGIDVGVRFNSYWKDLSGSETTIALITDGFQFDGVALIWRPGAGETFGTPTNVVGEVTFSPAPTQPKTVVPGTGVGIVFGAIATTNNDDLAMSPTYDNHVYDTQQLGIGWSVYASGAGSTDIFAFADGSQVAAIGGWFMPITSGGGATPKIQSSISQPTDAIRGRNARSAALAAQAKGTFVKLFPPPKAQTSISQPRSTLSRLAALQAQVRGTMPSYFPIVVSSPFIGRIQDNPRSRNSWPAVLSEVVGIMPPTVIPPVATPFFGSTQDVPRQYGGRVAQTSLNGSPQQVMALLVRPIGASMLEGVRRLDGRQMAAIAAVSQGLMPSVPVPFFGSVLDVPRPTNRWAAIQALADVEGSFIPFIPPVVPPAGGGSGGYTNSKKKREPSIRGYVSPYPKWQKPVKPPKPVIKEPPVVLDKYKADKPRTVLAINKVLSQQEEEDLIAFLLLSE